MIQHRCEGCGLESEAPDHMARQGIHCVRCGRFWTIGDKRLSRKAALVVFVAGTLALALGWLWYYSQ